MNDWLDSTPVTSTKWIKPKAPAMVLVALGCSALIAGCNQREVLTVKANPRPTAEIQPVEPKKQTTVRIYFVKEKSGQLEYVPVDRDSEGKDPLNESVSALLAGPTEEEAKSGLASEIPKGTVIIDAKDSAEGVELNLSKVFASDGGTDSIETRLEQLSKTVTDAVKDKKVYLDVEGNRLSEAGGDGIEVHQPINM